MCYGTCLLALFIFTFTFLYSENSCILGRKVLRGCRFIPQIRRPSVSAKFQLVQTNYVGRIRQSRSRQSRIVHAVGETEIHAIIIGKYDLIKLLQYSQCCKPFLIKHQNYKHPQINTNNFIENLDFTKVCDPDFETCSSPIIKNRVSKTRLKTK